MQNAIAFCDNDVASDAPEAMLSLDSDAWPSRCVNSQGNTKVAQLCFWMSALQAL